MLHVVNGDSTKSGLERSGLPGVIVSWGDVLHEGPTPGGVTPEEWRRVRVKYLASRGYGPEADIAQRYADDDATLDSWREHEEVVLWFEHDLYDQLILIRHLDWMSRQPDRRGTRFSLISGSTYLGPLEPEKLAALFPARVPITDSQVDLGTRAWRAFCSPEPDALEQITDEDTSALPFLAGALRRHFEDYPSVASGLSRSEAQILDAIESGAATLRDGFLACSRMEERIFMGDWTFLSIARGLASGAAHPLIAVDLTGVGPSLPSGPVSLTALGREVREGLADRVLLNGIDRWAGGVHLTMRRCYRWNGQSLVLTRS